MEDDPLLSVCGCPSASIHLAPLNMRASAQHAANSHAILAQLSPIFSFCGWLYGPPVMAYRFL